MIFSVNNLIERLEKKIQHRRIIRAKKIIVGSPPMDCPGWQVTDQLTLDVTVRDDFARFWKPDSRHVFFAEHVWEHLERDAVATANTNCFEYLKEGGRLRLAVPDGFHPDPDYIANVTPGGRGPGAEDHKILYDYLSLSRELRQTGFKVELLEYWDENRCFYARNWSEDYGVVRRSSQYDSRNFSQPLMYTSLIIDAFKP